LTMSAGSPASMYTAPKPMNTHSAAMSSLSLSTEQE
jgi:hypothetical protein